MESATEAPMGMGSCYDLRAWPKKQRALSGPFQPIENLRFFVMAGLVQPCPGHDDVRWEPSNYWLHFESEGKYGVIRRAAFQKPGPMPILMITQRNFDSERRLLPAVAL
jgi:hypothetical protein